LKYERAVRRKRFVCAENWQQKASSAVTFLLRVSLAAIAEKRKREGTSEVSVFGLVGSKQAATLHFMSASRISPLIDRKDQIIDISDADLSEADLSGVVLWRSEGTTTINADLSGVNLRNAKLNGADLSDAKLGVEVKSEFEYQLEDEIAWLTKRTIAANLSNAKLIAANLRGAVLGGVDLSGADLSEANLDGANLQYANLSGANLHRADLSIHSFLDIWKELYWLIQRLFFSEVDGAIRQIIVKFSRHLIS
jgi:hypothetical protein